MRAATPRRACFISEHIHKEPVRAFPLSFLRASLWFCDVFAWVSSPHPQSSALLPIKRNFLRRWCLPPTSSQDCVHSWAVGGPSVQGSKCPVPVLALALVCCDQGRAARASKLLAVQHRCLGLRLGERLVGAWLALGRGSGNTAPLPPPLRPALETLKEELISPWWCRRRPRKNHSGGHPTVSKALSSPPAS